MTDVKVTVEGLDDALLGLNHAISGIQNRTVGGLLAAGLIIQRESQRLVPIKTGNLRASAYTRKSPNNPKVVEVGYGAAYALYVHENLEAHHTVGEAKFLEHAVENKREEALAAIKARAKGEEAADVGDQDRA